MLLLFFLLVNFLCSVFKKKKKKEMEVFNIIKLLVQTIA